MKSVRNGWVRSDISMVGKNIIITGANAGIGFITTRDLVKRGGRVILACRNMELALAAKDTILKETGKEEKYVVVKKLDLSSLQSIRDFAHDINQTERRIDVLINNAGVMLCPETKTKDGFESHFGVNHLGHFLLTNLLLDLLKHSAPSRVVIVASEAHRIGKTYIQWSDMNSGEGMDTYCRSKLMNILFARELSDRLKGSGVTVNSLHPGVIRSGLWQHLHDEELSIWRWVLHKTMNPFMKMFWKSPEYGAQTTIYCSVAPELLNVTGKYFSDCAIAYESGEAKSKRNAVKLWNISCELTGINEFITFPTHRL
uniref:Retinol dehydrogenase 12-like n=1 Tax=Ciona intestinalis TaxID=7719 RepID=F6W3Q9_CIOIN|nr:retinol dehydrogenase 12-like isoform X1 [Ciona intestinalis]|eukprot:XP_002132183.1 retinol dehydrogenase 12-like isoform X1 [Ciona intestinalis]